VKLAVFCLVFLFASFDCAAADEHCFPGSHEQAKALALKAAAHLQKVGPQRAFRDFHDPKAAFIDGDLYVFVVDFDGNMWANGAFPEAAGSNALGARDRQGRPYIEQMLQAAKRDGEGWIQYEWLSPCTGDFIEKSTYFKRVGQFVVAVGSYGSLKS
jgi:cytochrome c